MTKHRGTKSLTLISNLLYPERIVGRPKTRGDCAAVSRPCPYVGCLHNLYMDVTAAGHIRLNGPPDLEPWDVPPDESCALDLADRDGMTLEAIGNVMNITRERVRQIETDALQKLDEEQDYEDYDTEERQ